METEFKINDFLKALLKMFSSELSTWSLEQILNHQEEFCSRVNEPSTRQDTAETEEIKRIKVRLPELRLFVSSDLEDQRLLIPGSKSLAILAEAIRQLGALIEKQLAGPETFQSERLPVIVISDLFNHTVRLADCLRSQLQLLNSTEQYVTALADIFSELIENKEAKFSQFRNLSSRIQADDDVLNTHTQLLPVQGLELSEILSFDLPETFVSACLTGVQSARLVNWISGKMGSAEKPNMVLVQAALLQDVGLVLFKRAGLQASQKNSLLNHPDYQLHPQLSSAIASSYAEAPCELSLLLSQHHELLDGTGFPNGLRTRQLTQSSRFLITAVRFHDLLQSSARMNPFSIEAPWKYLPTAANKLLVEAKRGELDSAVTAKFLDAIYENWHQVLDQELKSTRSFSDWLSREENVGLEASPMPTKNEPEPIPTPNFLKPKQTGRKRNPIKNQFHQE